MGTLQALLVQLPSCLVLVRQSSAGQGLKRKLHLWLYAGSECSSFAQLDWCGGIGRVTGVVVLISIMAVVAGPLRVLSVLSPGKNHVFYAMWR